MASNQSLSLSLWAALALTLVIAACPVTSTKAEAKQKAVGSVEPADPNDDEVQKVVDFAVKTYNDLTNDLYVSKPIEVMSASQQGFSVALEPVLELALVVQAPIKLTEIRVVGGMNFYLKINLGRTKCTKAQSVDLADCPFNEPPDQQETTICNFEINTVSWENKISMTNFNCHSA